MQTLRNERGFIQWIPLVICILLVLYVGGMLAWDKVATWARHRELIAEHRAKQAAAIEEKRIAAEQETAQKQIESMQAAYQDQAEINRRLIDENAKTADRIATAHEQAADEIATSHRNMADMMLQWADRGQNGLSLGVAYLLGAVALVAIMGLVATVFFVLRQGAKHEGPTIIQIDGQPVTGRIASGADVYKLIEHRKESMR
jgi:membrane-associated HD superfamily phosphohydrolase